MPTDDLDRRRFLRTLGGAAGVLVAGLVLAGCPGGGGDDDDDGGGGGDDDED